MSKNKVTLWPSDKIIEVDSETPLLSELKKQGIYIKSSCGGCATCSDCTIRIREGADQVNPPGFEEVRLLGNVFHITKERLACQLKVLGNITIDISMHDQLNDEQRMLEKTTKTNTSKTKLKTQKQVEEDQIKKEEEFQKRKQEKQKYFKYWEKGEKPGPSHGGKKRPKQFRTDDPESEDN